MVVHLEVKSTYLENKFVPLLLGNSVTNPSQEMAQSSRETAFLFRVKYLRKI